MSKILPNNEPFFFPGGSTGCLLIHGLTGTPKEMRWMGEFLSERGYTVLGIRLPGHATDPEDLRRIQRQDWLASAEDGWHLLNGVSRQIFLIGLSLGGILSLLLSTRFPVKGVVAISTPYRLPKPKLMRWIRLVKLIVPTLPASATGISDWRDKEAEKIHACYPYTPTHAVAEVYDLLTEMRASLPLVKAPTLLFHSRQDGVLPPENMTNIYQHLGSQDKQMYWVENSGHNIPRDAERQRVFQAAHEFIQRVNQDGS